MLSTLPSGLVLPDPGRPGFFVQPHEPLKLTVAGIAECDGSAPDLGLFVGALRFFVELERNHEPQPSGGEPLRAGSAELEASLGLSKAELRRVYLLVRDEVGIVGSGGGDPGGWSFEIPARIRRFRDVNTVDDYLERRVVPTPYPEVPVAALGEVVDRIAPIAAVIEDRLASRNPALQLLTTIVGHPLGSTIIGGLVVAVVVAIVFGAR